jgi:Subtilase family
MHLVGNAQNLTTYWYKNGIADSVYYRTDIVSFKCTGGLAYIGAYDTTVIDSIIYRFNRRDKANEVYFKSNSSLSQRLFEAQNIYNSGLVEVIYLNVSKNLQYAPNCLYTIDNLILINFVNPYPSVADLNSLMTQFNLTLFSNPDVLLPPTAGPSYTYVFEAHIPQNSLGNFDYEYIAKLLRDIQLNATVAVRNVSPNIIQTKLAKRVMIEPPYDPEPATKSYQLCSTDLNDTWSDYQWYIENDGFTETAAAGMPPLSGEINATVGADAKICECWAAGKTGAGVKVGIISTDDFFPIHSELSTQAFTNKWDCTNSGNSCIPYIPISVPTTGYRSGALMHMISLLAATKNNNEGIAGIAQNAEISTYITAYTDNVDVLSVSSVDVIKAIDQALIDKVDVLLIDYVSDIEDLNLKEALYKHHLAGRPKGLEQSLGTIIIAPAGHSQTVAGVNNVFSMYPAKYRLDEGPSYREPEVIGVITSDRYDKLEVGENNVQQPFLDGFANTTYPANSSSTYDVAAPGYPFWSTYGLAGFTRDNEAGQEQDGNTIAVVGGVVALVLEANTLVSDVEMMNIIRDAADKVGGYTYNSIAPYKSPELAGGRINCQRALNKILAIAPTSTKNNIQATVVDNINNWQIILNNNTSVQYELINNVGQVVSKNNLCKTNNFTVSKDNLSTGIYYLKMKNENSYTTLKLIR